MGLGDSSSLTEKKDEELLKRPLSKITDILKRRLFYMKMAVIECQMTVLFHIFSNVYFEHIKVTFNQENA